MGVDWNAIAGLAISALSVVAPFGVILLILLVTLLVLLVNMLSKQKMRSQPPGSLTIEEVRTRLGANGLSLADKRELARMFGGQRVRWPCTFREIFRTRRSMTSTALCVGEPHGGQFFFDPTGADARRLEQTPEGARMVVEGTLRVDLDHGLLTLDAPVVRFDLQPNLGATPMGQGRWGL